MRILSVLLVALMAGSIAKAATEPTSVAVVDMQKALQTVDAGKKAKAELEKQFNAKKKELQAEEASIKKLGEEFKKQSLVLNDEARMKKQAELQERVMKLQEQTARSQAELQQKEVELTEPIISRLKGLITEIARKKGYTVVLEKGQSTVLYSLEKDDLTADVITAYNSKK